MSELERDPLDRDIDFSKGARGKFVGQIDLSKPTVEVLTVEIDPELREFFPDSNAVNKALHDLVDIAQRANDRSQKQAS